MVFHFNYLLKNFFYLYAQVTAQRLSNRCRRKETFFTNHSDTIPFLSVFVLLKSKWMPPVFIFFSFNTWINESKFYNVWSISIHDVKKRKTTHLQERLSSKVIYLVFIFLGVHRLALKYMDGYGNNNCSFTK